ncbi:hypothetical protein [Streptomyces sp. NPDC050388]|uniref:YciI family protein n=1 Tax=Streptomyces sp. NPDC050388 TaxID=3155781 RepID=UPI003435AACC
MFVVIGEYVREWSREDPVYLEHREFMTRQIEAGRFLCSGPREGGGAVMIAYGDDAEALRDLLGKDPFAVAGYVRFELHQFRAGLADPRAAWLVGE